MSVRKKRLASIRQAAKLALRSGKQPPKLINNNTTNMRVIGPLLGKERPWHPTASDA